MSLPAPKWLPQDGVLVRFRDDPDLLHYRLVLLCTGGDHCYVATPDRDINEVDLVEGNMFSELRRMHLGRLPRGIREGDTYLPKHSPQGDFAQEEVLQLHMVAEKRSKDGSRRVRLTGKVGPDGVDILSGSPATPRPRSTPSHENAAVTVDSCYVWLIAYSSMTPSAVGKEVALPEGVSAMSVGGEKYALYLSEDSGQDVILARRFSLESVAAGKALLSTDGARSSVKDVRVLPVLFDAGDERWRTLQEAMGELEEVEFEDFPLQGPRTMFRDLRQLRRSRLDFLLHHEAWLKKSGVRTTDRSVHEHASICRALNWMLSYDQLNLPALASAEALNRRRTLIEFAHQGRPEAPSYEGAEDFLGVRESADGSIIDPALTQHAARRAASKAEVLKQQRLAAEEKKHRRRMGNGEDDEYPEKGKAKAKAKSGAGGAQSSP